MASTFTKTRLYDTQSWEYRELDAISYAASFTSDGRRMMTGDLDRFVRLWNVDTGSEISRVSARAFERFHGRLDDETVLLSSRSWLQVISFDHEALLEEGLSRLSRDLTEEECDRYLHGPCEDV